MLRHNTTKSDEIWPEHGEVRPKMVVARLVTGQYWSDKSAGSRRRHDSGGDDVQSLTCQWDCLQKIHWGEPVVLVVWSTDPIVDNIVVMSSQLPLRRHSWSVASMLHTPTICATIALILGTHSCSVVLPFRIERRRSPSLQRDKSQTRTGNGKNSTTCSPNHGTLRITRLASFPTLPAFPPLETHPFPPWSIIFLLCTRTNFSSVFPLS